MGLSSGDIFKSSLDKAFSGPGMKLNADTMTDAMKFKQGMKEVETKEATGSGSSGAYSGPVFGGDDKFWERSNSEKASLEEEGEEVKKVEATEATGSGSVGGYSSPEKHKFLEESLFQLKINAQNSRIVIKEI